MTDPCFLTLDEVLAIHADLIRRYGEERESATWPSCGRRSGLRRPRSKGITSTRAPSRWPPAYLFHIARNHPFVDGNKRTALMTALVFLGLNDLELAAEPDALFELVSGVAAGHVAKAEVAVFFQRNCHL